MSVMVCGRSEDVTFSRGLRLSSSPSAMLAAMRAEAFHAARDVLFCFSLQARQPHPH